MRPGGGRRTNRNNGKEKAEIEQRWRQRDGNDNNGDGNYESNVKSAREGGERQGQEEAGG